MTRLTNHWSFFVFFSKTRIDIRAAKAPGETKKRRKKEKKKKKEKRGEIGRTIL
jgi:hypothetical protein